MEPAIHDGDLVAVDSFQTERGKLYGQIVVIASEQTGLCVSRLRRFDRLEVLQAENHDQDPVILSKTRKYRIVGKVLWSISGT
jgi:SOS-response transcriptional repressor LexA